jgi:hypothetical protein
VRTKPKKARFILFCRAKVPSAMAKGRISENNTKEKTFIIFIVERKYIHQGVKGTNK